jgi:predicted MPP superfamily phosphohydrolase
VLFLKHQPDVPEGHGRFDLQLSGHTHAGQIYPFRWLVRLRYPMLSGLYELPGGGRLYVSRGTGTWGPPIRVFAPAEITVIELVPALP